jgi:apolipoprotein N-acyltransferase
VQTNNATYYGSAQPEQQWGIEQVRAVETGRDVVVASVNGISGFVSADGEVLQRTHSRDQQVLVQDVRLADGVTWGVRIGAWLERGLAALGAGAVVGAIVLQRRRRDASDPGDDGGTEAAATESGDEPVVASESPR